MPPAPKIEAALAVFAFVEKAGDLPARLGYVKFPKDPSYARYFTCQVCRSPRESASEAVLPARQRSSCKTKSAADRFLLSRGISSRSGESAGCLESKQGTNPDRHLQSPRHAASVKSERPIQVLHAPRQRLSSFDSSSSLTAEAVIVTVVPSVPRRGRPGRSFDAGST